MSSRFSINTPMDAPINFDYSRQRRNSSSLSVYYRRIINKQLDFEMAIWSMIYLVLSPSKVFRNAYHQKQTKAQWARDDPAFYILLATCMIISAMAYGIAYSISFLGTAKLILYTVGIEFLLCGLLFAALTWTITNKYMLEQQLHAVDQQVEYLYCFDVHCNAFIPFFLITYVIQLFFLYIVTRDGFFNRLVANTIYMIASCYYCYITFLGFNALPFIKNSVIFLYPAVATVFLYFILTLSGINVNQSIFSIYFD